MSIRLILAVAFLITAGIVCITYTFFLSPTGREVMYAYPHSHTLQGDKEDTKDGGFSEDSSKEGKEKQPHILLIISDDQGYNGVGYNGHTEIKTPVIDNLAKTGVILNNYYVQPTCTPTRGQLFSGRHQIHTGLYAVIFPGMPVGLPLDSPTLADKLKEAGYSTNLVGKWHLGYYQHDYLPTRRGFDRFFGILNGYTDHFTYRNGGMGKDMSGYDLYDGETPANMDIYEGIYSTTLFSDKAIETVKNHDATKPLFLVVTFTAPHGPHQAPERCIDAYRDTFGNDTAQRKYAGMISCLDEAIGKITDAFKSKGLWNDTVMIYTSDNGGVPSVSRSNYPLRGHKGGLFEGGIKVPAFLHSNLLKDDVKGTISEELLHVTDWFPTLAGMGQANLHNTKPLYGYDVRKTIFDGESSPRKEIVHDIFLPHLSTFELFNDTFDTRIKAALRSRDWKILTGQSDEGRSEMDNLKHVRLYNIKNDPSELYDLTDTYTDVVKSMLDRLQFHRKSASMTPVLNYNVDKRASPKRHHGFWGPWM